MSAFWQSEDIINMNVDVADIHWKVSYWHSIMYNFIKYKGKEKFVKFMNIPEKQAWIQWKDELKEFETYRESHEWVYNGDPYNEIGYNCDGYRFKDPKMASALVYELTRKQTFGHITYKILVAEDYTLSTPYLVWIEKI